MGFPCGTPRTGVRWVQVHYSRDVSSSPSFSSSSSTSSTSSILLFVLFIYGQTFESRNTFTFTFKLVFAVRANRRSKWFKLYRCCSKFTTPALCQRVEDKNRSPVKRKRIFLFQASSLIIWWGVHNPTQIQRRRKRQNYPKGCARE